MTWQEVKDKSDERNAQSAFFHFEEKGRKMSIKIKEVLRMIEEQTGVCLDLCNDFPGVHFFKGRPYFNVMIQDRLSESTEYKKMQSFTLMHPGLKIEPNGLKRIAIFLN